jgi:hypothetical protein
MLDQAAQQRGASRAGRLEIGRAALIYAGLALLATWPLLLHIHDHVPGSDFWGSRRIYFEAPVNVWNLWWFRHALLDLGQSPFTCQHLFYPYGADLWFHTLAPLHGLLALPLQAVLPLAAAQNLLLLGGLVAAGACTYALGRDLGLEPGGALLAGGIYAFSPAAFAHLYAGHYELLATYWLPAMLLLFLRLIERPAPRLRDGAALGLVFAAAAYSCQYYVLYGAELLAVTALAVWRHTMRASVLRPLATAGVIALAGMTPLISPFLRATGPIPRETSPADFTFFSGDLVNFLVPSFTHPVFGRLLRPLHERLNPGLLGLPQETTTYLGFSVLALALLGLRGGKAGFRKPLRLLGVLSVVFAVLSLGSRLKIFGIWTEIPLPAALLAKLPVLSQARAPGRHGILLVLGLGMLAGLGWPLLRRAWLRWSALGLLAFEYASAPLPLYSTQVAPAHARLAEVKRPFAVLELPFGIRDGRGFLGHPDANQILAQTVHRHPIVTGMVSRLPEETWRALTEAPVIGTLLHPRGVTEAALRRDLRQGAAYFSRWRIEALLIHPMARDGAEQRYLERVLPIRSRERFADGSELLWIGRP